MRDNRRVVLLPAGEILIDHAHRVMNAAAEAVSAVHLVERGARSSLSVGAIYSSLYAFLPEVLRAFTENHPEVELHLQEMTIRQQTLALAEGVIEVGLLRGPIQHRDIQTRVLYHEPLVLATPTHGECAASGKIAKMALIAVGRQPMRSYSDRVFELFERHDLTPRLAHQTQDMHTAMCLVSAGLGVSIVPAGIQLLKNSGVEYCDINEPLASVSFALAMRKGAHSSMLDSFVDAAEMNAERMLEIHPSLFKRSA